MIVVLVVSPTEAVRRTAPETTYPAEPRAHRALQAARPSPAPPSHSQGSTRSAVREALRPLLLRQLPPHRAKVLQGARLGLFDEVSLVVSSSLEVPMCE